MFLVAKQVSERVCAGAYYLNLKWEVKESGCEHKTIVCWYPGTGSRTPSVDSLLVVLSMIRAVIKFQSSVSKINENSPVTSYKKFIVSSFAFHLDHAPVISNEFSWDFP